MSKPVYVKRYGRMYAQWPSGYVYFATFVDRNDAVKIGWSQNPWWRVVQLGHEYGTKVRLIETIEIQRGSKYWGVGYDSLEARLHRAMARERIDPWTLEFADRGEWYSLTLDEVAGIVAKVTGILNKAAA
jgi:hypothetical protein